jgi:hypothetical protein
MKKWQFWLGVLISILFLWLALRGLKLGDFWGAMQKANYIWLVPGILVYFVGVWVRAWRWHYLLGPIKKIPTKTMFPVTTIGYMGNNIYPARAGEVLRAVVLKRKEGVSVSASLATIIVERIFDGVVMLAFVFVNLSELAKLTGASGFVGNIQQVAIWGSAIFAAAMLTFLLAAALPYQAEKFATWAFQRFLPERIRRPGAWFKFVLSFLLDRIYEDGAKIIQKGMETVPATERENDFIFLKSKAIEMTTKFLSGLKSLRSPFNVLMVFLTSVVIWLLETGKYWFVMHAFDFSVSFFALMLMNGIVNLATTIPSAPGYIGTFDAPGIAVLTAYGVDHATAAGYTLVLHVALWVPVTALGAYYLTREGIKWNEFLRAEAE